MQTEKLARLSADVERWNLYRQNKEDLCDFYCNRVKVMAKCRLFVAAIKVMDCINMVKAILRQITDDRQNVMQKKKIYIHVASWHTRKFKKGISP